MIYERHFGQSAPEIDLSIKGRFEKISNQPELYFDLAHNARAMRYLGQKLARGNFLKGKILRLYFNCMKERDPAELLEAFFEGLLGEGIQNSPGSESNLNSAAIEIVFLNHTDELHTFTHESIVSLKKTLQTKFPAASRAFEKAQLAEAEQFRQSLQNSPGTIYLVAGSSRLYGVFSRLT